MQGLYREEVYSKKRREEAAAIPDHTEALTAIQAVIHRNLGVRTDVHYREGYGALFVPEGAPLTPANVIVAYSEEALEVMALTSEI